MTTIKFFKRILPFKPIYDLENIDNSLTELAVLLAEGVDYFGSRALTKWIDIFLEDDGDAFSTEIMSIEQKGNDLYIGNIYENCSEKEKKYFTISRHKLIELMKLWDKLTEEEPDEITLIEHNNYFDLIKKNYPQQQRIKRSKVK